MSWNDLQKENEEWSSRLFPMSVGHAEDRLFGIVEECGEIGEALGKQDRPSIVDGCADVMIFLSGYCTCMGWQLDDVVSAALERDGLDDDASRKDYEVGLLKACGTLSRAYLKGRQRIRGNAAKHAQIALETTVKLVALIWDLYDSWRVNDELPFPDAVRKVWDETVSKRDRAHYPDEGAGAS